MQRHELPRLCSAIRDQPAISQNDLRSLIPWQQFSCLKMSAFAHLEVHWVHSEDVSMQLTEFGQSASNVINVLHSLPDGIHDLGAMTTKLSWALAEIKMREVGFRLRVAAEKPGGEHENEIQRWKWHARDGKTWEAVQRKPASCRARCFSSCDRALGAWSLHQEGLSAPKPLLQYVQIRRRANLYILKKNEMLKIISNWMYFLACFVGFLK